MLLVLVRRGRPVLLSLILGIMIAILPAGFVVSRAPRNNLVHLEATFVALAGFPVSFAINLVATFSMEPCRRQGVLGLVGIAPAYLVTVPLFVLAVLGRISARCEAAVKAGLVVWFAAFAVAAVGVVRHGGHWEEIVRLVALLGFCALLVAAVVGFGLFCYAKMGRRRPGADTAFFVWFSLWIVLYPISATAHVGG